MDKNHIEQFVINLSHKLDSIYKGKYDVVMTCYKWLYPEWGDYQAEIVAHLIKDEYFKPGVTSSSAVANSLLGAYFGFIL